MQTRVQKRLGRNFFARSQKIGIVADWAARTPRLLPPGKLARFGILAPPLARIYLDCERDVHSLPRSGGGARLYGPGHRHLDYRFAELPQDPWNLN